MFSSHMQVHHLQKITRHRLFPQPDFPFPFLFTLHIFLSYGSYLSRDLLYDCMYTFSSFSPDNIIQLWDIFLQYVHNLFSPFFW